MCPVGFLSSFISVIWTDTIKPFLADVVFYVVAFLVIGYTFKLLLGL